MAAIIKLSLKYNFTTLLSNLTQKPIKSLAGKSLAERILGNEPVFTLSQREN